MPYTPNKPEHLGNVRALIRLLDAGWAALKHAVTEGRDVTDVEMTALHMVFCPEYKPTASERAAAQGPGVSAGKDMGGGIGSGDRRV